MFLEHLLMFIHDSLSRYLNLGLFLGKHVPGTKISIMCLHGHCRKEEDVGLRRLLAFTPHMKFWLKSRQII